MYANCQVIVTDTAPDSGEVSTSWHSAWAIEIEGGVTTLHIDKADGESHAVMGGMLRLGAKPGRTIEIKANF